jgi:hypothetical protein
MKFTAEMVRRDLERLVDAGKRGDRLKVPHKFLKARLSERKPIVSIDEKDYSALDLLNAVKQGDPLIKEIIDGGIEELNRLFESDTSGTEKEKR